MSIIRRETGKIVELTYLWSCVNTFKDLFIGITAVLLKFWFDARPFRLSVAFFLVTG